MTTKRKTATREELSALLRQYHSILGTAWPRPGVAEMADASIFVGTTLFAALQNGMSLIQDVLSSLAEPEFRRELAPFWGAFSELFFAVQAQDRYKKCEQVDSALNLLYLASGVFYHRATEGSAPPAPTDDRLRGVEGLEELLRLCRWSGQDGGARRLLLLLTGEMKACASRLRHAPG